jgi:hypothetical protein
VIRTDSSEFTRMPAAAAGRPAVRFPAHWGRRPRAGEERTYTHAGCRLRAALSTIFMLLCQSVGSIPWLRVRRKPICWSRNLFRDVGERVRVVCVWRNTTVLPRQHLNVIVSAPKGPGNLIGAFLDVWVGLLNGLSFTGPY